MAERMIRANGVEVCTESFGDPADPPVLLVMGIGASMLWWDEGFCRMLADGGRFVIRYDHRDTGRSVSSTPGGPAYTGADLVRDAAGVLDAYGVSAAHVVGVSAGGAFAQRLALEFGVRVLSLVLISTSPAAPTDRELPPPTDAFGRFVSSTEVDWSDRESVTDYLVAYSRLLAGGRRPFDEAAARELVGRDVDRAQDFRAARNHELLRDDGASDASLSSVAVPTLVIHGTADPMFPLEHGEALAEEIPGASLLRLEDAGHGVDRSDSEAIARGILDHTASADRATSASAASGRSLTGRCACGAVEYEVADEFLYAANCHCSACRAMTGTAFKSFAGIERTKLALTKGEDAVATYGDAEAHDARCETCHSFLYSVVRDGAFVHVAMGSLADAPSIRPTEHIFVGSKAPWFEIADDLPQFDEYAT